MADEDEDQRTEHPTGKRLGEARDKGQLAISREVVSWVTIVSILISISWLTPGLGRDLVTSLRAILEAPDSIALNDSSLKAVLFHFLIEAAKATGLIFIVMAAAPIIGIMTQTGLYASTQLITPDFMRINPLGGLKKLFSVNTLIETIKSLLKFVLLGFTAFLVLYPLIDDLPHFAGLPILGTLEYLRQQATHLIIMLLLVFSGIAIADYYYQNWRYIKNLRMTRAEVKDEHKQMEGDPIIKGRLRQIRLEKARKRMMAQVPKADVVVTNPTHYAIALEYDNKRMTAPKVLAKGIDRIAERIREVAEEHKIPFVSNPPLARALYDTVDIDQEIPTQHYRAVAEIISYVYKLKKRKF